MRDSDRLGYVDRTDCDGALRVEQLHRAGPAPIVQHESEQRRSARCCELAHTLNHAVYAVSVTCVEKCTRPPRSLLAREVGINQGRAGQSVHNGAEADGETHGDGETGHHGKQQGACEQLWVEDGGRPHTKGQG